MTIIKYKVIQKNLETVINYAKNDVDKTILEAKINHLTEDIDRLNSKIQTCRRIIIKSEKGEKEDWLIKKRFEDNKKRAEKVTSKNKNKKRER